MKCLVVDETYWLEDGRLFMLFEGWGDMWFAGDLQEKCNLRR